MVHGGERSKPDGVRLFQLRILAGMRDNDAIVDLALERLGADRAEMDLASKREPFLSPAGHFEDVVELLGPPLSSTTFLLEPDGPWADRPLTKLTYRLPLWPDLEFYLSGNPRLPIAYDFGFARPADTPAAAPNQLADLRPWACLRDEVIEHFGAPVEEGDRWAPFETYIFKARHADGSVSRFRACFSWNLLQRVTVIEEDLS